MKTKKGVMIMLDGKGWGLIYSDGHSSEYGWIDPEVAEIHDPEFCKNPLDATYKGSPYIAELSKGRLVNVERKIIVSILG